MSSELLQHSLLYGRKLILANLLLATCLSARFLSLLSSIWWI
jgi:hypothetical protein